MYLVIIAWLYVTFTMALTMETLLGGIALFGLLGIAPGVLVTLIAVRRLRARRERSRTSTSRDAE